MIARDRVAREIMTSPGIVCSTRATVDEIVELLADREISGLPVLDDDEQVVGVISERDLAKALGAPMMRLAMKGARHTGAFLREPHGHSQHAEDIMSSPAVTVHPETPMHTVAEIMIRKQVNRVPVVDQGRLLGVVSRGDVLGAVAELDPRTLDLMRGAVELGG